MPTVTEGNPRTISLTLANDHYTVLVGSGLLADTAELISSRTGMRSRTAAIVTDSTVGPLYAETVLASL